MHKTEFTNFPNLRNVICAKDIKKQWKSAFDIITKKTDKIPAEMVSEYVHPTYDGKTRYKETRRNISDVIFFVLAPYWFAFVMFQ